MRALFALLHRLVAFEWLRLRRGRQLRVAALIAAAVSAATLVALVASPEAQLESTLNDVFFWGMFNVFAYALAFVFHAGIIADEVQARTLAFLVSRPLPRPTLLLSKYVAGSALSWLLLWVALLVVEALLGLRSVTLLRDQGLWVVRAGLALMLLTALYAAVASMWSALLPEAAATMTALHLGIFEFAGSWMPGSFRWISFNYAAQQLADLPPRGLLPELAPLVDPVAAAALLIAATALFLGLAIWTFQTSEYRAST